MRASVSSRPSRATLSKIPGETVWPAIATRTGWNTFPGLTSRASTTPRSAASIVSGVNGSACASASRAAASVSAPPSLPIVLAKALGSSTGPSNRNDTSGQKSASVWIFSAEISTAPRRPVRPV